MIARGYKMVYITTKQKQQAFQISFEDLLFDRVPVNMFNTGDGKAGTITRRVEVVSPEILSQVSIDGLIEGLKEFVNKHENLYAVPRESLYYFFKIPKKKGGLRDISEPNTELKSALTELKEFLENKCGALYHTSAFAYIKRRSTEDAVKKHQKNESNWFLKTDFSNFFPSTNLHFIMRMLSMIFPFNEIMLSSKGKYFLTKAISLGMLKDGLPQGSPLSPTLTNIMMIPIDHTLFNGLHSKRMIYTRYADDMLISCIQSFNYKEVVRYIRSVLKQFNAPFDIKDEKTRYGSRAGQNWNLGLMLNKDNQITVGYMNKKHFKASLNNYILDRLHDHPWSIDDVKSFQGIMSYYKKIEPDYFNYLINHYNQKYCVNVEQMIKNNLKL